MSTPSFIDQLAHIQSCVRNGEKWEWKATLDLFWNESNDQSVELLTAFAKHGYGVRLVAIEPQYTCDQ